MSTVTLIGHPWVPIGMGEQLRSHAAAMAAVRLEHRIYDLFRYTTRRDPVFSQQFGGRETHEVGPGVRIFHLNGNEVDDARAVFAERGLDWHGGRNIIVPAWELPVYPAIWVEKLRMFDEVWALSRFVQDALAAAGVQSHLIGQSVELPDGPLLPRRHFGIRESAFAFLHFFDISSYASRKNPDAVLEFFTRLQAETPLADMQLVLKVKHGEFAAEAWARAFQARWNLPGKLLLIDQPLDAVGVRSLIAACDCFVSLHRSEGFGRGMGEAMALGRLAMGTHWSGSTDFLTAQTGVAVGYRLVPVEPGAYPEGDGQVWAEPDVADAVTQMRGVLASADRGRGLAQAGQRAVLRGWSNRAVGLRILERLGG